MKITLDGQVVEAKAGEMIIAAAERAGTYIPRFCYHPRMRPVGMCRMCLVDVKGPRGYALLPACFVPVAEGQEIVTDSDRVKKAQDGVLEFLLVNHPLDCPVCDKGGECPLQDQTLAFGPGESRFVEEKRHWAKPIALSDLVYLDRERCIQCDRCTRFADEVAGDRLIQFVGRGAQIEVNTFPDHPFSSYFSGNTVQICPVGALTAKPYRFKARPWDLDQVESTCTSCSFGCRVAVQSTSNELVRYLGIDVDPVNWGWLCDKGRFDFEAFNSADRLEKPLVKQGEGGLVPSTWGAALEKAAGGLAAAREQHGAGSVAVLGGARLTNEDAYAWSKLARTVLGTDSVDCQLGDGLPAEVVLGLPRATIDSACAADTVLLLGPDLKEELPVLYLRLRHAVLNGHLNLVEVSPIETGLTPYASVSLRHRPGESTTVVRTLLDAGDGSDDQHKTAGNLLRKGSLVCILGRSSVAEDSDSVVQAAARLIEGLPSTTFLPVLRRANVNGALDMGLAPGVLPGRVSLEEGREWFSEGWGAELPATGGLDATGILTAAAAGDVHALVLVGADPLSDFPDRELARRALAGAGFVVAIDCFTTASVALADVVLPAAGYAEKSGTTTNIEGRISRLHRKVTAPGTARTDWMIAAELAFRLGGDLGFETTADIWDEIECMAPAHAGITRARLMSAEGRDGIVIGAAEGGPGDPDAIMSPVDEPGVTAADTHMGMQGLALSIDSLPDEKATSERNRPGAERPPLLRFTPPAEDKGPPPLDSYSLRVVAKRRLYDHGTLVTNSPSLAGLSRPGQVRVNPIELDRLGLASGADVRVTGGRSPVVIGAIADPAVPRGSVVFEWGASDVEVAELIDAGQRVTEVRMETA